jgi:hypothetical protein
MVFNYLLFRLTAICNFTVFWSDEDPAHDTAPERAGMVSVSHQFHQPTQ